MSNASNALSRIGLTAETVFGEVPSSPSLTAQRFASASFTLTKDELLDESKTGTRQYQYTQQGNSAVAGSLSSPLAHNNFDSLFESALYGAFTSNVLKVGNTVKSFTIEEAQPDINVYRQYSGMIANGFALSSPVDGLTTIDFDFVGLTEVVSGTSLDSTYTAQQARQPFTHCGGTISYDGSPIAYVSSVDLSYTNNLTPTYAWGLCTTADIIPGRVDVTGTLSVYFANSTMYNHFVAGSYHELEFTLSDGTNTLTFLVPRIKYNGADAPIDSGSGQRLLSLPFRATYDTTEQSTLVITRSA